MGVRKLGAGIIFFGSFFFFVAFGAIVQGLRQGPVVIFVRHDSSYFARFFPAGIASHGTRLANYSGLLKRRFAKSFLTLDIIERILNLLIKY